MKNLKIYFILIQVFVYHASFSQEVPEVNHIFWKISGNNLAKPSYLFGTHHLYSSDFIKESDTVQSILSSVDKVVGEIVVDEADIGLMFKMMQKMMLKDKTLKDLLSEEDYKATDNALKKHAGMGILFFNKFKPIFVYQTLTMGKYMKSQKIKPDDTDTEKSSSSGGMSGDIMQNSMDAYFQKEGKKQGKEIGALESAEAQMDILFNDDNLEEQVKMLLDAVYDREEEQGQDIETLSKLYQQQKINDLFEIIKESTKDKDLDRLLTNRNKDWIPKMEEMFKSGKSIFFAVGAGHLPGDIGVIYLLMQKGYTVKPIPLEIKE